MPRSLWDDADTERRFWKRVDMSGECWIWLGAKQNSGYGQLEIGGRKDAAHRVAWRFLNGPIPEGMFICHHCDNPSCVRPSHLFLGTASDNMRDKARKGRANNPTGERHGSKTHPESVQRGEQRVQAKLTEAQVREMRAMREAGAYLHEIAARFGICRSHAGAIVRRKLWTHV